MNILITSASAKVLLVKSFVAAAKKHDIKVFTADIEKKTAASFFSDGDFVLPKTSRSDIFKKALLDTCIEHDIRLIIPTRDGEIKIMSEIKRDFNKNGIKVLVPDNCYIDNIQNKKMFSTCINNNGFKAVPVIDNYDGEMKFPLFARPTCGSGGHGARRIDNVQELNSMDPLNSDEYLIHPFLDLDEFSIDVLMDIDGSNAIQAVCRQRIFVVAGESKISRVVKNDELSLAAMQIGKLLSLVGHNVIQAFYSDETGPIFIEANPRFGGASNLSIEAGLKSPEHIIRMMLNKKVYINDINVGMTMYRYSEDIFSNE